MTTAPPSRRPPGPTVSADWLAAHADEVVIADVRWYLDGRSGRAAYDAGHLPGARFVDLDHDLSAPPTKTDGRHPLPDPAAFAAALGRLGIGENQPVVAYDDANGCVAARLWWMLSRLGEPAAVLDGGLAAWRGSLSADVPPVTAVKRPAKPWPAERFVDGDAVADAARRPDRVVLDARSAERYAHGDRAIDPRPGHIPGARSAPWADNVDPETGCLFDAATLRRRFEALGISAETTTIAYCGSGVSACHDLLALEVAGFGGRTALYPGSWSAWGADPERPAATGSTPLTAPA
jgi:thiosulfate/3-mercaptopyruvate sulfurtransferase